MRNPERDRRVLRRWTVAAIAVIVLATSGVALTYTPLFAAGDIQVRGAHGIARAQVLALARVDEGSNVFHFDPRAAERRLERDPRILTARVTRSLPDGLTIEIASRVPVGVLGAARDLVGADGVVIGPAERSVDLPELVVPDGERFEAEHLETAAAAANALDPTLRRAVDAVVVSSDGGVEVRLAEGFSASFGDPTELAAKAESLGALLAWVREHDARVVSADLSVPGSPTATLRRGSEAVPVP
jgi:cell division protein FtsQ